MKKILALVSAVAFLAAGCKAPSKSSLEVKAGEFSKPNNDVDLIPAFLKDHGIAMSSLSMMEDGTEDRMSLSFQNSLVSAWLSSLSYGSADQIAAQLLQAGILDASVAQKAITKSKSIQIFRVLSDSYAGNGPDSIGKYRTQWGAKAKLELGYKALPALYNLAIREPQFKDLDSDLESEWRQIREGQKANPHIQEDTRLYLQFLKSNDPASISKNLNSVNNQLETLDLVFKGLTSSIVKIGKEAVSKQVWNQELEPLVKKVRDQISDDPSKASLSFNRIAELLEYGLVNDESEKTPTSKSVAGLEVSSSRMLLFSGGRWQWKRSDLFREGSTQLLIIEHRNNQDVFFVFRGTSGLKDIFVDIQSGLQPDSINGIGQVHAGISKAFLELTLPNTPGMPGVAPDGTILDPLLKNNIDTEKKNADFRPILSDVLNRASLNSKRIWIAGHSLGGGLALMFLKKLLVSPKFKPLVAGTYTIGAPWIGDPAYAEDFDSMTDSMLARVVRMRYQNDLISVLNPKNKFARESQLAVLSRDGGCFLEDRLMALFKVNPSAWFHRNKGICSLNLSREEADKFANKNRSREEDKEALADHSFFNYLKALAQLRLSQK